MDIVEASSTIDGIEISYLTCRKCDGSYYDDDNLSKLKQVFGTSDENPL